MRNTSKNIVSRVVSTFATHLMASDIRCHTDTKPPIAPEFSIHVHVASCRRLHWNRFPKTSCDCSRRTGTLLQIGPFNTSSSNIRSARSCQRRPNSMPKLRVTSGKCRFHLQRSEEGDWKFTRNTSPVNTTFYTKTG